MRVFNLEKLNSPTFVQCSQETFHNSSIAGLKSAFDALCFKIIFFIQNYCIS